MVATKSAHSWTTVGSVGSLISAGVASTGSGAVTTGRTFPWGSSTLTVASEFVIAERLHRHLDSEFATGPAEREPQVLSRPGHINLSTEHIEIPSLTGGEVGDVAT